MGYFSKIPSSFASKIRSAWGYIFGDPRRVMITVAALGCTAVSLSIAFAYAAYIVVPGWQLWSWLAAVIGILLALIPPLSSPLPRRTLWILFSLLAAALAVRLFQVGSLPPGLHVDEMGTADFAMRQVFFGPHETINPFITGPDSQPVLFHYLEAAFIRLFGPNILSLRLLSALAGSLGVVATYLMVRAFSGQRTAFFAAALMVTYHYHVHWSRISLNNIWDTVWVPLMLGPFLWGWRRHWSGGAAMSGLAVGLSQYFYAGSKVGLILLALLVLGMWKEARQEPARWAVYLGKLGLVALCVAAPMAAFALHDPVAYSLRTQVVMGWSPEAIRIVMGTDANLWQYFWHQFRGSFGAYFVYPDDTGFYRPGVPLVFGPAAILFGAGVLWAGLKKLWLPVAWVILTAIFGGFLLSGTTGSSHFVVSIPAICWLIALPLNYLAQHKHPRLAWLLLGLLMLVDLGFYFISYAALPSGDLVNPFPPFP